MARRAKPELALPTVWQCTAERQWLCPLAGWNHVGRQKIVWSDFLHGSEATVARPGILQESKM
jgi:hypothetical protein